MYNTDGLKAGTGFMISLSEVTRCFELQGYGETLVPEFDHFTYHSGQQRLDPKDILVDRIFRFENSSDPDDQAILYAISFRGKKLRGLYIDSYGIYHDDLSEELQKSLIQ